MKDFMYWQRKWDEAVAKEKKQEKIQNLLNSGSYIFYFTNGKSFFGAPEDSRLIFAKMKGNDKDMPEGWEKEANFMGYDLMKVLAGDEGESIFGKKDIKKIKVMDIAAIANKLMNAEPEKPSDDNMISSIGTEFGINMIPLKDKK